MFNQLEYQTVVLAALLHDIGKFLQRGSFGKLDISGKHPQVSANFVSAFGEYFSQVADLPLLTTLVQRHHESPYFPTELRVQDIADKHIRSLAFLVSKADNLSSAERGERLEQWDDFKAVPMASVFGRVKLDSKDEPITLHHHLAPLASIGTLGGIFAEEFDYYSTNEMNQHLQSFGSDFRKLLKNLDVSNFECVCSHLLGILHRYTWCIPSNTQEKVPDVSLFDHLKTTAAIAACLYQYHSAKDTLDEKHVQKDSDRFFLAVGDLSGIQNYIFDIATTGAGGVARRLRARSLYVQMVVEAVSHMLLRKLGLPLTNAIMVSGGKFYCLLPNTEQATATANDVQRTVDMWFLQCLNGELALNISGSAFGDKGFGSKQHEEGGFGSKQREEGGFGTVIARSSEWLALRKGRRFVEALASPDGWLEDIFTIDVSFEGQQSCLSCHKHPRRDSSELCEHCELDRQTGAILPKSRYFAFFDNEHDGDIPLAGYSASLLEDHRDIGHKSPYLLLRLNDTDLAEVANIPALPKYMAKHVALMPDCNTCSSRQRCTVRDESTGATGIATFGCIANRALGRPLLGFLKADADRMSHVFRFGLKRDSADGDRNVDTISRLSTLSRQLDTFFTGWMQHLAETEFDDCYTVFSGGDDLFFVGPWNRVIELAERANSDFRRLTANPDITLSVGIATTQSRYPVARASELAENALEKSKQAGGDSLTLLGRTMSWPQWESVRAEWEKLKPHLDKIPSAFLHALVQYGAMWQRYLKNGDTMGLRYQPLLAYNMARNIDARQMPDVYRWAELLLKIRPGDSRQRVVLDYLGLIATLLILSRERGG